MDLPHQSQRCVLGCSALHFHCATKLTSFFAVLLLTSSGAAQAATIKAASPSLANVTAAIASAADGDTVVIPAGTASDWTTTLVITKGITLQGQTTTNPVATTANDQTIILDNITNRGAEIIKVTPAAGKKYRISGITLRAGTVGGNGGSGAIGIYGDEGDTSQNIRVDHCHFYDLHQARILNLDNYAVIDHNVFDFVTQGNQSVFMTHTLHGRSYFGDQEWARPARFGTDQFVFIEDNCVNNHMSGGYGGGFDTRQGGRWVARHNHIYNCNGIIGSHGTELGSYRGGRAVEVYNNDFHYPNNYSANIGGIRGGAILSHDNTFDGAQPHSYASLAQYRTFDNVPLWGGAWGDNPWDVNVTEADGTHVDGHAPYLFASGTATTGTGTSASTGTIVDTSKSWTANQWVGYSVKRVSDGQGMHITSNTSNTLIGYAHPDYRRATMWAVGDQYQIHKVLVANDQSTRGWGDLVTGSTGTVLGMNSTTGGKTWTHQKQEPAYSYNDKYTPTNASMNFSLGVGAFVVLQEGRDFFNNSSSAAVVAKYKASLNGIDYTGPYPYPHPLVSGSPAPTAISPPQDLRITRP